MAYQCWGEWNPPSVSKIMGTASNPTVSRFPICIGTNKLVNNYILSSAKSLAVDSIAHMNALYVGCRPNLTENLHKHKESGSTESRVGPLQFDITLRFSACRSAGEPVKLSKYGGVSRCFPSVYIIFCDSGMRQSADASTKADIVS